MTEKGPVLIFGGKGYLASHFYRHFSGIDGGVVLAETDVTQLHKVNAILNAFKPRAVINAAAKTHGWGKANIAGCEVSPWAKQQTRRVNTNGAGIVAYMCAEHGAYLVHISTGSIFQGDNGGKGFLETSLPAPTSHYASTKLQGDGLVAARRVGAILRIQMPVSADEHPRNLITKLAGAKQVMDLRNSITSVPSLLSVIERMLEKRAIGIFNVVNPGPVSHPEIVDWYCDIVDSAHRGQYEVIAGTAESCVLSTEKLERIGIHLPCAEQAIKDCLRSYPIDNTPLA
jgi:3,5-epimerase/4-reductase